MNRKIKFRAWDGKKMIINIGVHPSISMVHEDYPNEDGRHYTISPKMTSYQVMQFTGFTDKNGKEVYEGDIISKARNGWSAGQFGIMHDKGYYKTIVFKDGSFIAKETGKTIEEIIRPLRITDGIEYEVIGNIFENPELI